MAYNDVTELNKRMKELNESLKDINKSVRALNNSIDNFKEAYNKSVKKNPHIPCFINNWGFETMDDGTLRFSGTHTCSNCNNRHKNIVCTSYPPKILCLLNNDYHKSIDACDNWEEEIND